jgi:hypothetical protein
MAIKKNDFKSVNFEELTWDKGNYEASLDEVYKNVTEEAESIIGWYLKAKNKKRRGALPIRFLTIILASCGGLVPLLTELWKSGDKPMIPPICTAVFFTVAALLYGLDRFFGLSAGWMRYMDTQLHISSLLKEFRFNWQIERLKFDKDKPKFKQILLMIELAKTFNVSVYDAIKNETKIWMQDFQGTFDQLEKMLKKKS